MKKYIFLLLLALNSLTYAQKFTDLYGDYFGQTPPGDKPVVFAPGIVSTDGNIEHSAPTFSPDGNEVFWQTNRLDSENNWLISVMTMRRIGDRWTGPEKSPYVSKPAFSPDGRRLYIDSKGEGADPYFVEKQGNNWSEPKNIGLVARFSELKFVYNLSIARDGALYFAGNAEGFGFNLGIYQAELFNGEYTKPELLPPSINAPGGSATIHPLSRPMRAT